MPKSSAVVGSVPIRVPGRESNPHGLFSPRDFLATMAFARYRDIDEEMAKEVILKLNFRQSVFHFLRDLKPICFHNERQGKR